MVSVFSIFFLNYGLLYILAPFKWDIPVLNSILIGIYEDFNQFWFSDVGNMVISVMIINALTAPLEVFGFWFW